ncbi:MAG TPA: transglutaminase family protein [Caulobacteraceae bacterium]|jgi:transglutaminase-like putative cysteine protease|nr:transglutaminase family protein [Caulobacteraceae bacterium]
MRVRAGFEISYDCPSPVPMLLLLNVHPSRLGDLETPDTLGVDPPVPVRWFLDAYGNRCARLVAPAGRLTLSSDFVVRDSGEPDPVHADAAQATVDELPDEVLPFLLGSRYCETDRMSDLAWSLFGGTRLGWARVQAIVDYAHRRISFGYQHARPTKSAWDAHAEGFGVCRDFAHLAIALCRCMNIPARYCTGYLGDIGVPVSPAPMDFSAWFEVYLEGEWRVFDARHNVPRIGRILMARGRDAADCAITTAFGTAFLSKFEVITQELP